MARLGIAPHVADKVLNHQSGTIAGVAAVYQRHEFLAGRKDALERWGTHVAQIVSEAVQGNRTSLQASVIQLSTDGVVALGDRSWSAGRRTHRHHNRSVWTRLLTMNDAPSYEGFILFSEAVTQLARGMWGGVRQADPVRANRKFAKRETFGFEPWREQAGKRLTAAARKGTLAVYLAADPRRSYQHLVCPQDLSVAPVRMPKRVLNRMITSHGSLQDDPIRPSLTIADGDLILFALLTVGTVSIRVSDFEAWYCCEHARGRWPSQRSKSKSMTREGRPTKQLRHSGMRFLD